MEKHQNNINNINLNNDDITLRELFLNMKEKLFFLNTKWKIILTASIIGGLLGLMFAWFEKPAYKAKLTFAMEEDKGASSGLSGALGLASNFGIDLGGSTGGGAFAASNLTELMKSRLIVEKVLLSPVIIKNKKYKLADYYIRITKMDEKYFGNAASKNVIYFPLNDRPSYTIKQDSILQILYKKLIDKDHLSIMQKDKKVSILTIEVSSEDEFFSKIFCESIARETSEFYIQTKSKKAKINVDVLQKQVDSVKISLNNAITGVARESDYVYNLNPSLNVKSSSAKKKQIDVQANTSILTNLVVQLELAKITLRKETPLIQLIDTPIFPLENERIGPIKLFLFCALTFAFITSLYLVIKNFYY